MSWWKEERIGNMKNLILRSFDIRVFLILLVIGIIYLALMVTERLWGR